MRYLRTSANGLKTEGIGAMVQYQLHCYAMSKLLEVGFIFDGFKDIAHFDYHPDVTPEQFSDHWTKLFNMPSDTNLLRDDKSFQSLPWTSDFQSLRSHLRSSYESPILNTIYNLSPHMIMRFADEHIDVIEKAGYIKDLLKNVEPEISTKDAGLNISVHMRTYTRTDCDPNPVRELLNAVGSTKWSYYTRIIGRLKQILPRDQKTIHIYSQGIEEDFRHLRDLQDSTTNIELHIEEYPVDSLRRIIHSDVIVFSNSSFSYVPSLFGKSVNLVRDSFYHKTYSNTTVAVDSSGNFNESAFMEKLATKRLE